jgi:hypothetical protein
MKKLIEWLSKRGAHTIIRATFVGFTLWFFLVAQTPFEWIGFWVSILILAGFAVILLVVLAGAGRTWNDRQ